MRPQPRALPTAMFQRMRVRLTLVVPLVVSLVAPVLLAGQAPQDSVVRAKWRIAPPVRYPAQQIYTRVSPGLTFSSPTGFGPEWGDAFVGVGYQATTRYPPHNKDGAIGFGIGVGDAARYVGGELAFSSFGTSRSGLFTNSTISAKLHRVIGSGFGVAVGMENIVQVGATSGPGPDGGQSIYLAVSKLLSLAPQDTASSRELFLNLGVGNGRFRPEKDVVAQKASIGVFATVGMRITERIAAIADFTGQDFGFALSFVPFKCVPIIVTPGMVDLTGSAGDGARFVIGVGAGFRIQDIIHFRRRQCVT